MSPYLAEFIGTAILIILGDGVVANVVLSRTKGQNSGWIVIAMGWGMAVFVAVFCVSRYSGAHINPAVTLALAVAGKFDDKMRNWGDVPVYILCQMIGAFVGAVIVYLTYRPHFAVSEEPNLKLAVFCTGPAIRSYTDNFLCEVVGTFMLVLPIFLITAPKFVIGAEPQPGKPIEVGLGALGALPVALLVLAIGLSLGGPTGYAINPARDLGPRLAHAVLPIPGKRDPDWGYAWIPVVAPIIGGILAALTARAMHL
jgi:glycerol uptake facilitator protein